MGVIKKADIYLGSKSQGLAAYSGIYKGYAVAKDQRNFYIGDHVAALLADPTFRRSAETTLGKSYTLIQIEVTANNEVYVKEKGGSFWGKVQYGHGVSHEVRAIADKTQLAYDAIPKPLPINSLSYPSISKRTTTSSTAEVAKLQKKIKKLEERLASKENELKQTSKLQTQLNELQKELKSAQSDKDSSAEEASNLQIQLSELQEQFESAQSDKDSSAQEASNLQIQLNQLQDQLKDAQKEHGNLQKSSNETFALTELGANAPSALEKELEHQIAILKEEKDNLEQEKTKSLEKIEKVYQEQVEKNREIFADQIKSYTQERQHLNTGIGKLQEKLEALKTVLKKEQNYSKDLLNLVGEKEDKIVFLKKEKKKLKETSQKQLANKNNAIQMLENSLQYSEKSLHTYYEKMPALESTITQLKKELSVERNFNSTYSTTLEEYEKSIDKYRERQEKLRSEIKALEKSLKQVTTERDSYERISKILGHQFLEIGKIFKMKPQSTLGDKGLGGTAAFIEKIRAYVQKAEKGKAIVKRVTTKMNETLKNHSLQIH